MAKDKLNGRAATVYGLVSSAEPERIRYVGCTERRVVDRVWEHRGDRHGPRPVNRWVLACMERGEHIAAVVLQENATFADEASHVARLRADGADLLNETDGDKGTKGRPITEAHRRALHLPASPKLKATLRELHRSQPEVMLRGLHAASADPEIRRQRSERMKALNARRRAAKAEIT